ncbi:malate:quinone oxidoreductase [Hymenobacter lutimineralis]|uniref:Probable malate:quinone oxidoreductase n=1 Tax=Hymenobacter lutimineralis TaxID=2606448 RepID=A0A5D6VE26_9BACT|nr:malate:quinone oxidoreductase [Hymenobacter lutimineralis]TYZ14203.1 malate:quinone oxidoreductase [Hymenobacter lutimineralis]
MTTTEPTDSATADVVLIGAGIMSATLGMMLKELQPDLTIAIYERLDVAAAESSDAWNNAGTGHSAFCELNYTPEKPDGSIDISKAIKIAEQFEESKQFWSYLAETYQVKELTRFINHIPHLSFVWGDKNVDFLRKRHAALTQSPLFQGMEYTQDREMLESWMPLVMHGRDPQQPVAATRMDLGTDVNFGSLTRGMFTLLQQKPGVTVNFHHDVDKLKQKEDGLWRIKAKDLTTGEVKKTRAPFVFIGAGGGSLPLLIKSGIPEGSGFGGFPVSGQWLKCVNPAVIAQHHAKVYGKAAVGSPPMSVPHLDTRVINGKQELLFGPYAGFSTKFLKQGSYLDLPLSVKLSNMRPMIIAGLKNLPLTKYLINQVAQSPEDRLAALREYLPEAKAQDWQLEIAGQRVQVIKKDEKEGGILEFGTEVVAAKDGSIAALLGASPGASTAVSIMINLIQRCFPAQSATPAWQGKFRQMLPSFGHHLNEEPQLLAELRAHTSQVLGLTETAPTSH